MTILEIISKLRTKPLDRKFYSPIRSENILNQNYEPHFIVPGEDYFRIRLCELYLTKLRENFHNYIPFAISVCDFLYDQKPQSVPFFIDNRILNNISSYIKDEYIDFRQTKIIGPIPYLGDDVGLFIGLFKLEVSNLIENFFNIIESVVNTFPISPLSDYLSVAKSLGQGLPRLLGMKEFNFQFGFRDAFNDDANDPHCFQENYLVYMNTPEGVGSGGLSIDSLWVDDGRLYHGTKKDDLKLVDQYDFCLLKIERLTTRHDYRSLGFYPLWEDTRKLIIGSAVEKAKVKKVELLQSIAISPDLTDPHKEKLINLFEIKFQQLLARHAAPSEETSGSSDRPTRGSGSNLEDRIGEFFQFSATVADNRNFPERIGNSLDNLSRMWHRIPFLDQIDEEQAQSDENFGITINRQLAALKADDSSGKADPAALADVLTLATFQSP